MLRKNFDELMYSHKPLEKIAFKMDVWNEIESFLKAEKEKRMMILCSVRKANPEDMQEVIDYVMEDSEKNGNVHYIPFRHTQQQDPNKGLTICNTTNYMTLLSEGVKLQQRDEGEGYMFDLGAAIAYNKPVELISTNTRDPEMIGFLEALTEKEITDKKYVGPLEDIIKIRRNNESDIEFGRQLYKHFLELKGEDYGYVHLEIDLNYEANMKLNKWSLLEFGIANAFLKIAPSKDFTLLNMKKAIIKSKLEKNNKPEPIPKSYTKVAIITHQLYQLRNIDDILKQQYL